MAAEGVPAAREALLRRMYEVFSTDERDVFLGQCLAPDVDWPNMLDGDEGHWGGTVEHVYRFGGGGLVARMDVRAGS